MHQGKTRIISRVTKQRRRSMVVSAIESAIYTAIIFVGLVGGLHVMQALFDLFGVG